MTHFRRSRLLVALALMLTLSLSTTTLSGCYGQFAVTKGLYNWNGSIQNRFVKSLVFWAFIIIPAYALCSLGDFLIFNVIEFWGGKNVINGQGRASGPPPRRIAKDTIELRRGGHVYHLKMSDKAFALEVDGKRVAEGQPDDKGGLVLTNLSNKTVGYISPETIAQIKAKLAAAPAPSAG
jgi:hypothetical protein